MTSGSSSTLVTGSTPEGSTVSVKELNGELHLNLSAVDMAYANQGDYYADDQDNYVKSIDDGTHDIAEISLVGDTQNYSCTGTVNIEMDITPETSMGAALQKDDLFLHLEGAGLNKDLDLFEIKSTGTTSYNIGFKITGGTKEIIKGYAKLVNKETNQKYLANKTLAINITVSDINCGIDNTFTGKNLLASKPRGLSTEVLGDMYRFVGKPEDVDNYVCFGYDDAETDCVEDSENIYRIIGITPDGEIKLIKSKPLKEGTMAWKDTVCEEDICEWPDSDLYSKLNNDLYLNSLDSSWSEKIALHNWWYGVIEDGENGTNNYGEFNTADKIYEIETGQREVYQGWKLGDSDPRDYLPSVWDSSQKVEAKIGLMYLHDYYYASSFDYESGIYANCSGGSDNCSKSWMFIGENYNNYWKGGGEWTMTSVGTNCGRSHFDKCVEISLSSYAWTIYEHTFYLGVTEGDTIYVRPVFYLNSSVEIADGTGAVDDPFIIG